MAIITKRRKAYSVIYQKADNNGVLRQVWETFYDYQSALKRKEEIENDGVDAPMQVDRETKIIYFLHQYASKIGINQWSTNYYERNMGIINNYLSMVLKKKKIKDIQPDFGEKIIAELKKTPAIGKRNQPRNKYIPDSMLYNSYNLLKSTFDYLVFEGMIQYNPFHGNEIPSVKSVRQSNDWNLDYVGHLFENIYDVRLFIFMHIMFSTGMNISEVSSLSWNDIHISDELMETDSCYICSNKLLKRLNKNTVAQMNPKRIIKQFKADGFNDTNTSLTLLYKDIPEKKLHIHKEIALLLRIWKENQKNYMTNENPYDLVITLINGKPCDDRNMTKLYHKARSEASLSNLTLVKFKYYSQKTHKKDDITNADYYYSTLEKPLTLPKQKVNKIHAMKLNNKKINDKIKISITRAKNSQDVNFLIQQLQNNSELRQQLIEQLKAKQ
ncbi:hypothetical protein [Thomasclavelia cocleata]|uniref:hypothetical protein n=1 Tax=Thomasclavelia cocleata TaxID=69824 RepID=UPI002432B527|nr:hypothetical protein [Thomasclavelia cocleata]